MILFFCRQQIQCTRFGRAAAPGIVLEKKRRRKKTCTCPPEVVSGGLRTTPPLQQFLLRQSFGCACADNATSTPCLPQHRPPPPPPQKKQSIIDAVINVAKPPHKRFPGRMQLTLHCDSPKTPHVSLRAWCKQAMSACCSRWKPDVLRPGTVRMRWSMVKRLRP